jgi:ribosomal protein S18 acetylase RimI-like enzyme
MNKILVKKINYEDHLEELIYFFNEKAKVSSNLFTYFKKREFKVIKNHLATFLMLENNKTIGYSHLDKDGGDVWFGICMADDYIGRGYGKKLILLTLEEASLKKIPTVLLSVYKNNQAAFKLYQKVGFQVYSENENSFFMKKDL